MNIYSGRGLISGIQIILVNILIFVKRNFYLLGFYNVNILHFPAKLRYSTKYNLTFFLYV